MPEPCGHVMCQAYHHDTKPTAQQMSQAQNDFNSWASLDSAGLGRVERLRHLNSKPRRIDLDQAIAETIGIPIGSINTPAEN